MQTIFLSDAELEAYTDTDYAGTDSRTKAHSVP